MKLPFFRGFDSAAAKQIAKLPAGCQKPFHILGLMFIPSVWALALFGQLVITRNLTLLAAGALTLVCIPLATLSKFLFRRQRPPTIYAGGMRIKSYSFPSSHAYAAALGGGFFASLAFGSGMWPLGIGLVTLIGVIGVSRVYLGAHYPTDVVGGWLIGGAVLWIILASV